MKVLSFFEQAVGHRGDGHLGPVWSRLRRSPGKTGLPGHAGVVFCQITHLVKTMLLRAKQARGAKTAASGAASIHLLPSTNTRGATKDTEAPMANHDTASVARTAILALAEIKAAAAAFDRGEANVFDTLNAIVTAAEAYHAVAQAHREAA